MNDFTADISTRLMEWHQGGNLSQCLHKSIYLTSLESFHIYTAR